MTNTKRKKNQLIKSIIYMHLPDNSQWRHPGKHEHLERHAQIREPTVNMKYKHQCYQY